jgi:hypothetical protein
VKESHPHFAGFGNAAGRGIGGHHSARSATDEWLTPPGIVDALGGWQSFDLDPCAPAPQPYPTAKRVYTARQNGLSLPWDGRVYLNPPYSPKLLTAFLSRMCDHGRGTALIFARTETDAFFRFVWDRATAVLFLRGRINFHHLDGTRAKANSGAPSVLIAYGMDDADILAGGQLDGQFVPLRIPRSLLLPFFDRSIDDETEVTWRTALAAWLQDRDGPVTLPELYSAFASHPKARANPNYQAKLRQELQRRHRRVGRGLWERGS